MKLRFEEAHRVARQAQTDKGCTFRVTSNEHGAVLDTPPTGFVVGGAGYHAQRTKPFTVEDLYGIVDFVKGNAFGIWLDEQTNIWHFDEVTIMPDRAKALFMAGRVRSEIAIYDLERGETIYVDSTDDARQRKHARDVALAAQQHAPLPPPAGRPVHTRGNS